MNSQPRIYSVKELNRYVRMRMENDEVLSDVWIRGEISNYTHHSSGHMYFTLKDKDSRLKSVMFASHNQRLPFRPKEGMKVIARGNISVYERDGNYQFYAISLQPDGLGSLHLAFEQLKKKLEEEGLFAASRKRTIPLLPKAIGVITSPTGAAVRDVIITLQRRFPAMPVYVYPALVQGPQSADSVIEGIEAMNRFGVPDVLIVGRGGGSLEELWTFNEEKVARAIAASRIPVISAVGHETDFTIADFVADLRAATPTAAAELAVPEARELQQNVEWLQGRLQLALRRKIEDATTRLHRVRRSAVLMYPQRYVLGQAERLDRLHERLDALITRKSERTRQSLERMQARLKQQHPGMKIQLALSKNTDYNRRLQQALRQRLSDKRGQLSGAVRALDAVSPLKIMARGYGLVYDNQQEKLIRKTTDVQPGDMLYVRLADGKLHCQVWGMEEE